LIVPNAMDGVPDITQPAVKPGKDFTYEFTAKGPAVGMYHSHHDSAKQVTNGLVGAFRVGEEPLPNGIQPTPMVLNDAGVIGLSLNGKSFPATAPTVANKGDSPQSRARSRGLDAGARRPAPCLRACGLNSDGLLPPHRSGERS
jgi:manganese oxidase